MPGPQTSVARTFIEESCKCEAGAEERRVRAPPGERFKTNARAETSHVTTGREHVRVQKQDTFSEDRGGLRMGGK